MGGHLWRTCHEHRGWRVSRQTIACLALAAGVAWHPAAAEEAGGGAAAAEPADVEARLTPHVGQTIDLVELGTGSRFVRPQLQGLTRTKGDVTGIRITPAGERHAKSLRLAAIARIMAGRETIYEAAAEEGRSPTKARRGQERYERELAASTQRMMANGIEPWPQLTRDDHAAEVADLEQFVAQVRQAFPALQVTATHEFLVATDIPPKQVGPFVANLDAMHDFLCNLYGIPRGEPVWKGKCLVVAFLTEADFIAFENRFMNTPAQGVHGLCHQRSDGRVVMACHRGDDPLAFAHMLVHETSHGFNHRLLSPERMPSWLNEGIAEWVGTQVVPTSDQVPRKEAAALAMMQASGRVGEGFFAGDDSRIQAVQYGVASSLVRFLVNLDRRQFAQFVRSVKEGLPVEEALQRAFKVSLDDLLGAYGRVIGVPGLTR